MSDNKKSTFSLWPSEGGLVPNSISSICQQQKQPDTRTMLTVSDVHFYRMISFNLHTNSTMKE